MTTLRQDAWTQDEDLLLAEVVLRHIRDGSTQLAAFEEVGKKLSRTAAACGFRWNSAVRKQYKSAIELAKKQRKGERVEVLPKRLPSFPETQDNRSDDENFAAATPAQSNSIISFHSVIEFLTSVEATMKNTDSLHEENIKLKNELQLLQKERHEFLAKIEKLTENYNLIEEDYKALLEIMERARKMIVLQEDEGSRFKFQMDKNGNLERVKK